MRIKRILVDRVLGTGSRAAACLFVVILRIYSSRFNWYINGTMIGALYNYRRCDESCLQSWLEEGVTMIQAIQN